MTTKRIVLFLLFLSLAIYIFFSGWISFALPPGQYGVLVTKSGGIYPETISPGVFTWRWEGIIPTNSSIKSFTIKQTTERITVSYKLPSSEFYSLLGEGKPDFTCSFDLLISGKVRVEKLPSLLQSGLILDQTTLDEWTRLSLQDAAQTALHMIISELATTSELDELSMDNPVLFKKRIQDISARSINDQIEIQEISGINADLPDIELYRLVSKTYRQYQEQKASLLSETAAKEAQSAMSDYLKLERLGKWGELLDKHPSLIQLIAVTGGDSEAALKAVEKIK